MCLGQIYRWWGRQWNFWQIFGLANLLHFCSIFWIKMGGKLPDLGENIKVKTPSVTVPTWFQVWSLMGRPDLLTRKPGHLEPGSLWY